MKTKTTLQQCWRGLPPGEDTRAPAQTLLRMWPRGLGGRGCSRLLVFTDVFCHQKSPGLLLSGACLPDEQGEKHHDGGCGFQGADLISLFLHWPGAGMDTGRAFCQARGNQLLGKRRKRHQARRGHFSCSPPCLTLNPFPCPGCRSAFVPLKKNGKSDVLRCWRELWSYCPSITLGAFVRADAKEIWIPWRFCNLTTANRKGSFLLGGRRACIRNRALCACTYFEH